MPVVHGAAVADYKAYIKEAIESYGNGNHLDYIGGWIAYGATGKVKVVSPRKEPTKPKAEKP
jgi:hypothetical protein